MVHCQCDWTGLVSELASTFVCARGCILWLDFTECDYLSAGMLKVVIQYIRSRDVTRDNNFRLAAVHVIKDPSVAQVPSHGFKRVCFAMLKCLR